MMNGGSVGFGAGSAFSGLASAFATSTIVSGSTLGNGTVLASASDGSKLRCVFSYNDWGRSGIGLCKAENDEEYDMQID